MKKTQLYVVGVLVGLALLLGVNKLASGALRGARVDLTADSLYSLSDGTRNILAQLDEPVSLKLFLSEDAANEVAFVRVYATRVREFLEEYELLSDGMIQLEVIDPEPFSEDEDLAVQLGIAPVPLGNAGGDKLYFGLAGANSTDDEAVLPFFDPSKESLLEYEITKLVYGLAAPQRGVVGLLTSLPMEGAPAANPMMGQGEPPWALLEQLRESFEVRMLEPTMTVIPDDIDVLMIVHRKRISEAMKYAIDQYVLGGGRVLAFVDPRCEMDTPPPGSDQMAQFTYDRSSSLDPLLESWGLRMVPGKLAGDRGSATPLQQNADFVAWLTLGAENYDSDDTTISLLDRIFMPYVGILEEVPDNELTVTPLIKTTRDSMELDISLVQYQPDPDEMFRNFVPEDREFTLAARVTGPTQTAYPGGPPKAPEGEEQPVLDAPHRETSDGDINVIVVADADMLHERFWLRRQTLGPILLGYQKTADNGDFATNCIDNLSGSDDLISIRGGQKFARPFDRVKEIEQAAEQNYLREVQDLEDKIASTEGKISELQRTREDGSSLILTPEQEAEIDKLREEQLESRKKLRAVNHEMQKDIEGLGFTLKVVHLGAVPLGFLLLSLIFSLARIARRS